MTEEIYMHPGIGSRGTHTRAEIMEITRNVLREHGHRGHSPQGGYSAKKLPDQVAKSNMPNTYPAELKTPLSEATLDRMSSGVVFEDDIAAKLRAVGNPAIVVIDEETDADGNRTEEGKAAKEQATFDAYLDPQVRFIFNARLAGTFAKLMSEHLGTDVEDRDRVSEPDAIELGPVMANGLRAARFIDVKWHKTASGASATKRYAASPLEVPFFGAGDHIDMPGTLVCDDWMQLAHYYRHGRSLGMCDHEHSLWGGVIGKEEVVVWARIDEPMFRKTDPETGKQRQTSPLELYDRAFAHVLEVIDNAIARDLDPSVPALTYPEWSSDVADSEWREVCLAELFGHGDGGHITLLPGVTALRAVSLYQAGITAIGDLARLDPSSVVDGVKDISGFVNQARCVYTKTVATLTRSVDLPRADIEVDFDYEADHVLYQRGVRVTDNRGSEPTTYQRYFEDFTGTAEGERDAFVAMWQFFADLVKDADDEGASICFYHYSKYERTADRKVAEAYAGQPGVPAVSEVEAFYDSPQVCDMLLTCSKELMWPTMSHSIKDIAKFCGFSWPKAGSNGAESIVWYRNILKGVPEAAELITQLEEYNGADTMAQLVIRNWIHTNLAAGNLPHISQVDAPARVLDADLTGNVA